MFIGEFEVGRWYKVLSIITLRKICLHSVISTITTSDNYYTLKGTHEEGDVYIQDSMLKFAGKWIQAEEVGFFGGRNDSYIKSNGWFWYREMLGSKSKAVIDE